MVMILDPAYPYEISLLLADGQEPRFAPRYRRWPASEADFHRQMLIEFAFFDESTGWRELDIATIVIWETATSQCWKHHIQDDQAEKAGARIKGATDHFCVQLRPSLITGSATAAAGGIN